MFLCMFISHHLSSRCHPCWEMIKWCKTLSWWCEIWCALLYIFLSHEENILGKSVHEWHFSPMKKNIQLILLPRKSVHEQNLTRKSFHKWCFFPDNLQEEHLSKKMCICNTSPWKSVLVTFLPRKCVYVAHLPRKSVHESQFSLKNLHTYDTSP